MRLLFEGGSYLRAALNNGFTVSKHCSQFISISMYSSSNSFWLYTNGVKYSPFQCYLYLRKIFLTKPLRSSALILKKIQACFLWENIMQSTMAKEGHDSDNRIRSFFIVQINHLELHYYLSFVSRYRRNRNKFFGHNFFSNGF